MRLFSPLPIAWRMLIDKPSRFFLSGIAVAFSVVIMFMELGFFNGSNDSAANLPPHFTCDLILSHQEKNHLKTGEEFPFSWILQARDVAGVAAAVPLYTSADYWWNPQDGTRNRVFVLGVDIQDPMFASETIAAHRTELQRPGTVIYDRLSRSANWGTLKSAPPPPSVEPSSKWCPSSNLDPISHTRVIW